MTKRKGCSYPFSDVLALAIPDAHTPLRVLGTFFREPASGMGPSLSHKHRRDEEETKGRRMRAGEGKVEQASKSLDIWLKGVQ
jgi:hypothetical protein